MKMKISFLLLLIVICPMVWAQVVLADAFLVPPEGKAKERSSEAIAIYEDTILIGVSDGAYVYERNSTGQWVESAKLEVTPGYLYLPGEPCVAIYGDTAMVGAYVFERNIAGAWTQTAVLDPQLTNGRVRSIAVYKDLAVVISYAHLNMGDAFVFERNKKGSWLRTKRIPPNDFENIWGFGNAVSIHENQFIVGACEWSEKGNISYTGAAFVYEKEPGGSWRQSALLRASDEKDYNEFGYSVAISENIVAVGKKRRQGAVYIFEKTDSGFWGAETQRILPPDGSTWYFGSSVALSGEYLIVGAEQFWRWDSREGTGAAYIYKKSLAGVYTLMQKLTVPIEVSGADYSFGQCVGISGDNAVISGHSLKCTLEWCTDTFEVYECWYCSASSPLAAFVVNLNASGNPGTPLNLSAFFGYSEEKVQITWDAAPDSIYYEIYRDTKPEGQNKELIGSTFSTSYEDTIDCCGYFYYWVKSVNFSATSDLSNSVSKQLAPVPSGLKTTSDINSNIIYLSWEPYHSASSFDIYRSSSQNDKKEKIGTTSDNIYEDLVAPCNDYYYWVVAVYPEIESGFSEMVLAKMKDCSPTPPQEVTASRGTYEGGIRISWSPVDEANWYQVWRGTSSTSGRTLVTTVTEPFYADTSVFPSTPYFYQIKAVNEYGPSAYSNIAMGYFLANDGTYQYADVRVFAADGNKSDFFGKSVAVDENVSLIGAIGDKEKGADSGAAYVFEKDGNNLWVQKAKLLASDGQARDRFGNQVALSGDTALIGTETSHSAYIFEQNENKTWQQTAILTPPNTSDFHQFGYSLDVYGSIAVIGNLCKTDNSLGDDLEPTGEDMVYVYEKGTDGQWTDITRLSAADGFAFNRFGESVAISDRTIMVGTPDDDDNGTGSGSVYVFEKAANNIWIQSQKILPSDGSARAGAKFGNSVAVYEDTALVSAIGSGAVYSFKRDEKGLWQQVSKEFLGSRSVIALHEDIAVLGGMHTGKADVYKLKTDKTWTRVSRLLANDVPGQYRTIKQALGVSGQAIFVGGSSMDCFYLENRSGVTYGWICEPTGPGSVAVYDIDKILTPALPVNVSVSDGEYKDKIQITWKRSFDVITYEIYRSVTPGPNSEKIKIGQSKSNTFTDTHLAGETRYYYWVKAVGEFGESDFSSGVVGFVVVDDGGDPGTSDPADAGRSGGGCFINGLQD